MRKSIPPSGANTAKSNRRCLPLVEIKSGNSYSSTKGTLCFFKMECIFFSPFELSTKVPFHYVNYPYIIIYQKNLTFANILCPKTAN